MKKLSREEFQDRLEAINRARKIFIETGITNNISVAFEIYQEMLAETERKLTLTKELADGRIGTMFDEYERPDCPECGEWMYLRSVNDQTFHSQLVCSNPKCDTALNSPLTIDDWKKELKKREA
jgi:predicted RNA-binding Zn-ribbon protein involved in translation (DUF1610 family)